MACKGLRGKKLIGNLTVCTRNKTSDLFQNLPFYINFVPEAPNG